MLLCSNELFLVFAAQVKVPALEMQQVQYFLAMCKELNFSRAARRCGVSQPTLSNAIRALERELGGALFHRKPSIALTELGRMVRPYLDDIARNANHACDVARTLPQTLLVRPDEVIE